MSRFFNNNADHISTLMAQIAMQTNSLIARGNENTQLLITEVTKNTQTLINAGLDKLSNDIKKWNE